MRSAPILALRGKNGWRAMPVPLPLTDPPSSSTASQKSSPLSSVCRRRNTVSPRKRYVSTGRLAYWPYRMASLHIIFTMKQYYKEALASSGCSLLGQAHLSEWCLIAFFLASPRLLSSAAPFAPSSAVSVGLQGYHIQLCMRFRFEDTTQGSCHLVAQFVGNHPRDAHVGIHHPG